MDGLNNGNNEIPNEENKKAAIKNSCLNYNRTNKLVFTGVFTAVIAVMSQISLPSPTGVPITLQTFAIALAGFFIGWKQGLLSTLIYIILGAAGVPVFSNFTGGFGKIVGLTGGFIWGFLPFSALCGAGQKCKRKYIGMLTGLIGLGICHFLGVLQFSVVSGTPLGRSFMLVSFPYILKDVASVAAAYFFAEIIKRRLKRDILN